MLLTHLVQIAFTVFLATVAIYGAVAIKREGFIRQDDNEQES